ncbi:exodeoxyribonuclease V subunit alpha [Leeia oryzae]|uniref:exodeoxyribonuclease V subunit alpha n=1 Tax=Leeia oryzae TaxID=356662 RepID=UPI0003678934|nr:exodeoxyribonuclease V subunit alpha [Leeia oryzae]
MTTTLMKSDHATAISSGDMLGTQLADALFRLAAVEANDLHGLVQRLVAAIQAGHVCLTLDAEEYAIARQAVSSASRLVGLPGEFTPLILDGRLLYLARYWFFESQLATSLQQRLAIPVTVPDEEALKRDLDILFPASAQQPDWQKVAAAAACVSNVTIISGGPGTGKTSTVLRLLLVLQASQKQPLRIRLAAPTGKAAARMAEGLRHAQAKLTEAQQQHFAAVIPSLPTTAETLHRLLVPTGQGSGFQHHRQHPLALDVLVVDEASMIDLGMMYRLVDALPPNARLILLGDKEQLSSVEAGSVFADLCARQTRSVPMAERLSALTGFDLPATRLVATQQRSDNFTQTELSQQHQHPHHPLSEHLQLLTHSYRFASEAGIGTLARGILQQQPDVVSQAFAENAQLQWVDQATPEEMLDALTDAYAAYFEVIRHYNPQQDTPADAFAAFDAFRILTVLKDGAFGASGINRALERRFQLRHWIKPGQTTQSGLFTGLAIMVSSNDYSLNLYNGDIGLILPDAQGQTRAWFPAPDHGWRSVAPSRLPAWQAAWAMTVHKSQGSEFDHTAIVLPDKPTPLLSRALLYTAVTRAKTHVSLWGKPSLVQEAILQHAERMSGLVARLQGDTETM